MTDQELRRLSRADLIDIIYTLQQQKEQAEQQLAQAQAQLQDRQLRLANAGSIAEAALSLNGVFDAAQAAAESAEAKMNAWLDTTGARIDVIQMRALEAPIRLLRGMARWQLFLKMYFKGDLPGATRRMQALADEAPAGVRAELEVNPSNLF